MEARGRIRLVFLTLVVCGMAPSAWALELMVCQLLTDAQVSAAVGAPVEHKVNAGAAQSLTSSCKYVGVRAEVLLTVQVLKTETDAIAAFEKSLAIARGEGHTDEPLHGVTTFSRYFPASGEGTIVARLDNSVIHIISNSSKAALVALARAWLARLTELRSPKIDR